MKRKKRKLAKLKPCPECHKIGNLRLKIYYDFPPMFEVVCRSCGGLTSSLLQSSEKRAYAEWNRQVVTERKEYRRANR